MVTRATLLGLTALTLAGCNLVFGLDAATETLAEGGAGGNGGAGGSAGAPPTLPEPWACVGSVPPISTATEYVYRFIQSNGDPVEQATITLCQQEDDDCSEPLQDLPLEEGGYLHIELEPETSAYLKVQGKGGTVVDGTTYRDVIVQLTPLVDVHHGDRLVTLYRNWEVGLLFSLFGVDVKEEPNSGILAVYAGDCDGNPAPHLSLVGETGVTTKTVPVYFDTDDQGNPVIRKGLTETSAFGVAGFLNYSTNNQNIRLELTTENDATVSKARVLVRDQTVTYIFLPPNE